MTRYFFDTDDGRRHVADELGIDLAGLDDVRDEVVTLLQDLAQAEMMEGRPRAFSATVRDDRGRPVFQGTLTLDIEHVPPI